MKRQIMLMTGAALLAACTEASLPTDPGAAPSAAAHVATASGTQARTDAIIVLDDVIERILPGLSDPASARPVASAISGLRTGLLNANPAALRGLIAAASNAVEHYRRTGLDEADLDAIRLALDHATDITALED